MHQTLEHITLLFILILLCNLCQNLAIKEASDRVFTVEELSK
jgi:hypothetical protein